jgi:hypothetical protein
MSNYSVKQASSTVAGSAIVTVGLMGALLMAQLGVGQSSQPDISLLRHPAVRIGEISKTFGQYTNSFTGEYENPSISFEETITSFYAQFLTKQEPLGKEFEQVLYDNLWDLLVRT